MQQADPPSGAAHMERLIRQRSPQEPSWETNLRVCQEVLSALWTELVPFMGQRGARAVVLRAVQVAGRREPLAGRIRVTETGLDFSALYAEAAPTGAETPDTVGTALARTTAEVLDGLIGPCLLRTLLGDVELALDRQAARLATRPEARRQNAGGK
ncbi:MAG: hypothetical protein HY331_12140 [Chloroflexi bacterium]|nr:hypothetical protein [Chloroflexota bacterium]